MNRLILASCILLLCSCVMGEDYQRSDIYQDNEIVANLKLNPDKARPINRDWYKSFGDEDLNRLVGEGLTNSPNIKTAIEKLHQARYQLYIDRADLLPQLNAAGSYNKSNQNLAGTFPIKSEYFQLGADASWELDIWGGKRRLNEGARALLEATAANLNNVQLVLTAEIANKYIGWRLAEKQLEITQKNLNLQKEIFDVVNSQYKAGMVDDLAYQQAKSVLETTQMQIPLLRNQEKAYQNALAVLTGQLPDNITKTDNNLLDKAPQIISESLTELPVDVIRNRPDVQAAEQQLIAQNALIGAAIANLFPSVSLSAFLGYQNKKLSPIFGPDYNMYTANGGVNIPLLHWGALINQVHIQQSTRKEALALYQASLLTAIADISNAITEVTEENIRNQAAKRSMLATTDILELSMQKYDIGLIDFSDVLIAEQNKLVSEQAYINSNADVYLNVISFYKAVGGGYNINRKNQAC